MCLDITLMRSLEKREFQEKILNTAWKLGWDREFFISTYMELSKQSDTILHILRCTMLRSYIEFCVYKEGTDYVVGMRGVWAESYKGLASNRREPNIVLRKNRKVGKLNYLVPQEDYTYPTIDLVLEDILKQVSYFQTFDKERDRLKMVAVENGITYDKKKDLFLAKEGNAEHSAFEYVMMIEAEKQCPKD